MHPRRLARLNELLLQTISQLALKLKDPEVGFITITGADTSADVSLVKIYYSVLGEAEQKERTAAALDRAKSHLKRELGKLENLRKVPDLLFVYDKGIENADRVNRLLHAIQEEKDINATDNTPH